MVPAHPGKTSSRKPTRKPWQGPVAIIGVGNVGTALAWALHQSGARVAELVVRRAATAQQKKLATDCGARLVTLDDWKDSEACTVWICVPDDALANVAEQIARTPGTKKHIYLHTSGARSYRDLAPLKQLGASIGAAHPFRSFPRPQRVELDGTFFAVEGDSPAREAATALVRRTGAVPFALQTKDKALYHAFGAFASPLLIGLLAAAAEAGERAGIPAEIVPRLLGSLAKGTFANWRRDGAAQSFSGPVARGDIETVRLHLASLAGMPELDHIYRALAQYCVQHLPAKRRAQISHVLKARA